MTHVKNSLFYVLLWLLPKNFVSRLTGRLVSVRLPVLFAGAVNKLFVRAFKLDMSEAERPLEDYPCLQDLFTRRLKADARRIEGPEDLIVSPCDGLMSEAGMIKQGRLLQVKGKYYSVSDLLGSSELAERFEGGHFATIYLSPRDYHRFHIPVDGQITQTIYIPGALWPVNPWAVANIKNLFCQNERIISLMTPKHNAKMLAHIAVGATVVGKITLAYCPLESNLGRRQSSMRHDLAVERGQDLGVFKFGSTIIMLFEPGLITELMVRAPYRLKVGQAIAKLAGAGLVLPTK